MWGQGATHLTTGLTDGDRTGSIGMNGDEPLLAVGTVKQQKMGTNREKPYRRMGVLLYGFFGGDAPAGIHESAQAPNFVR